MLAKASSELISGEIEDLHLCLAKEVKLLKYS
jgi:hypothetical protein